MTRPDLNGDIVSQVRVLIRAIQALDAIESSDPFERALAELFQAAYKRRLTEIVEAAPPWVAQEVSSAGQAVTVN